MAWEEELTNNKQKDSTWPLKPWKRPSYPQREVSPTAGKKLLPQKWCISTSHLSPALIWDNTLSKPENNRLAPSSLGRNPAVLSPLPSLHQKTLRPSYPNPIPRRLKMLSLSQPGHLHTVSGKHFPPEKCGAASELLAQSCPRKGCCRSV